MEGNGKRIEVFCKRLSLLAGQKVLANIWREEIGERRRKKVKRWEKGEKSNKKAGDKENISNHNN